MSSKSFISSVILHGIVLAIMMAEFSFPNLDKQPPIPAILMVDLTKVRISDKTNLPPKIQQKKKKTRSQPQPKPKEVQKTHATRVRAKETPLPPKPKPLPPVKNAAKVVEPEKKTSSKIKDIPKKKPQKELQTKRKTATQKAKKATPSYDMKSLLASVEKVRKQAPVAPEKVLEPKKEQLVNQGIEGGSEGSFSQILTISERDLIANQIKKCWNVDAGAAGVDDVIVKVKASVNKDGKVRSVTLLNQSNRPGYQTISESAVRAIWICDAKGNDSPFRILAHKYADHYRDWKDVVIRFNPMDGSIF